MRWSSVWSMVLVVASGCGGARSSALQSVAAEPPPDDHWETVMELRLASPERCTTGPFEVIFPEREVAWGRRIVLEVHGPRGIPLRNRLDTLDMNSQWGMALSGERDGDHSRCRVVVGEEGEASAEVASAIDLSSAPRADLASLGVDRYRGAAEGYPELEEHRGELPERVAFAANAWFPRGNPLFYADELHTAPNTSPNARPALARRLRFWFDEPADLSGVVLRIREQLLTPDVPLAEYRARFEARVRDADARREEARRERGEPTSSPEVQAQIAEWYARRARCAEDPSRVECFEVGEGGLPPPPRQEERPPAPSGDVDWVPGYWVYNSGLDDFLWLSGTYVARPAPAPPEAPAVVAAPPAPPPPPPEPAVAASIPPSVAAAPAARAEVIPPPPPVSSSGAVWVPGYWRLEAQRWVWTAGAWRVPPGAGMRHRPPIVTQRGEVRIYLPGGWLRIGR